jgi:4-alpha-glucanotransferase
MAAALPRSAGVLLHVTSLPSRWGIGDLGPSADAWIDQLVAAGQTWWQFLPLTAMDEDFVPYAGRSAFAGEAILISPDRLVQEGLLSADDLPAADDLPVSRVDFPRVAELRRGLLERAHERFTAARNPLTADYDAFRAAEAHWLDDYTLFAALKAKFGPRVPWSQWPRELARREDLSAARQSLAGQIDRLAFEQFLFHRQLARLRSRAREAGIRLIGDVPIYVATESADVWARPDLFQMTPDLRPRRVSGVPPDWFSKTGQIWRNPLYAWANHRREGFDWWIRRIRSALGQADLVRIDHFRALSAYWSIPGRDETAERGKWVAAPGRALLSAMHAALGDLPVVAEDLGVITLDVEALRDGFGLPGMRVLHFAFGGDDGPHLPHNYPRNAIAYTGTHDNDTTAGWHASLDAETRKNLEQYAPEAKVDPVGTLLRLAWQSVADVAIAPLQDLLGLDSSARMNTPGTTQGNWAWRITPDADLGPALDRLKELTATYFRTRSMPMKKE